MANRFQRYEAVSTPRYVTALRNQLRWQVPSSKVAELCEEVEAHLTDRTADLMVAGLSWEDAQRSAIAGFGPTRRYVRRVVDGVYCDLTSRTAQVVVLVPATFLLLYLLLSIVAQAFPFLHIWLYAVPSTTIIVPLCGLMIVSACVGKKPQARTISLIGASIALVAWIFGGMFWRTGYRGTMTGDLVGLGHRIQEQYDGDKRGVRWLKAGTDAANTGKAFPPFLREGNRFIAPRPMSQWKSFAKAFHQVPPPKLQQAIYARSGIGESSDAEAFSLQPLYTAATEQEARALWRKWGNDLLPQATSSLKRSIKEANLYPAHYLIPKSFDPASGSLFASRELGLTLLVIAADTAAALIGRTLFILLGNYGQKRRTTC